jgi:hypothetical protein
MATIHYQPQEGNFALLKIDKKNKINPPLLIRICDFAVFSVLYFCLLLPLLLAVVQGAESLAGWRLNFSVPR